MQNDNPFKDAPLAPTAIKTRVLFVYPRYPDGTREVLALFPDMEWSTSFIASYAHIGQHSGACPSFLKRKRATAEQYAPLAKELERIGYNLTIMNEEK